MWDEAGHSRVAAVPRKRPGSRSPRRAAPALGVVVLAGLLVGGALAPSAPHAGAVSVPTPSLVTEDPADNTPQVLDGSVDAVVRIGGHLFLGGTFSTVANAGDPGTTYARSRLLSFDIATGRVDTGFAPSLDGEVDALDTDGTSLYVGGAFAHVNDAPVGRVAKLSVTGALVPGFTAPADALVKDLVVRGSRVYVGGSFTSIGSPAVRRSGLAALDTGSGRVLSEVDLPVSGQNHGGATGVAKLDVTPNGRTLVAVGNFTAIAGHPRRQIAMVTLPESGAAVVSPWATDRYPDVCSPIYDSYMRNLDISPDGRYVVVSTTGGYYPGTLCDTTARWEIGPTTPAAQPTWVDYTGGDTTYGVAVAGPVVYVGGHFRWENNPAGDNVAAPGAVPREGLAALDPRNGLPLSWNPGRARGVGAQAMYTTSDGLWVGSDTDRVGQPREQHGRIAFFPLTGGQALPVVGRASWPGSSYQVTGAQLTVRQMDAAGHPSGPGTLAAGPVDWSGARGTFLVNGTLYYGLPDGALYARTFDAQSGAVGPQRAVPLYDADGGARIPFDLARLVGAFFDPTTYRLYYALSGDNRLYYRYFSPQSEVVGAQQFVAPSPGVDLRAVAGMTLSGNRVYYGSTVDGALRSVLFARGAVAGSPAVVSSDGSWRGSGLFVPAR